MLLAAAAWSQRSWTTFGPLADRALGFAPGGLALSPSSRLGTEIAVLDSGHPRIVFFAIDSSGVLVPTDSCILAHPQQEIVAADLEGPGSGGYVALAAGAPEVTVISRKREGHPCRTIPAMNVRRIAVADIDNDRRPDILLFGRTTAGVATLLNRGPAGFAAGPLLFPDISVSDLAVADLNGDGINDVFLLNWLSNQLVIFYGISRAVFSEQIAVDIPGEPSELAVSPVTIRGTVRIAVTIPSERRVDVFAGNSLGDFMLAAKMETPAPPSGIRMLDVNGDGLPDLVSSTVRGILVLPAAGQNLFGLPQLFGTLTVEGSWTVGDADGDGLPDIVAADRSAKSLRVIGNAAGTGRLARSLSIAVGSGPRGVMLADMDGDGLQDIVVANSLSGTVSVLMNEGNRKLSAQLSVAVPDQPWQVSSYETAKQSGIVVSHPSTGRITVISGNGDLLHASPYSMSTSEEPSVVEALAGPDRHLLQIIVRSRRRHDIGVGLSSYEQLSRRQYLERTIRPTIAAPVLAVTGGHKPDRAAYDLLFAAASRSTRQTTVYSANATSALEFGEVTPVLSFPDSAVCTRQLVWGRIHPDGSRQAAVVLAEPENALGVFRLMPGGASTVSTWIAGVHPQDAWSVVLQDVDGDGIDDLLVLDGERGALVLYQGKPGGRFQAPQNVVEGPDLGGFCIGPVFTRDASDLVVSMPAAGCVTLFADPFRRHGQ